jgi:hypothetical protein
MIDCKHNLSEGTCIFCQNIRANTDSERLTMKKARFIMKVKACRKVMAWDEAEEFAIKLSIVQQRLFQLGSKPTHGLGILYTKQEGH